MKSNLQYKVCMIFMMLLVSYKIQANSESTKSNGEVINEIGFSQKKIALNLDKQKLLNGKVIVDLPEGFGLMSEEMLAVKYPASNRPTLVYTNEQGSVNFAFNHTFNDIPKGKLPEVLPAFVQQFNSIYPQIQWFKKDLEVINGQEFIVLEFITPASDSKIYNLMYVTVLEGRMLMCTFNCIESLRNEWESKAKNSLNSIEINE